MKIEFFYAGCYTRLEQVIQPLKSFMLSLIVSGFEYMKFYDSSKRLLKSPVQIEADIPCLLLIPPGITLDFSTGRKRENWVAMLELPEVRFEENSLESSYNSVPLQPVMKLEPRQVYAMRELFSAVVVNIASGQPGGREKAKLQLGALIAELIAAPDTQAVRSSRAEAMKNAIDADTSFRCTVREHNERLGYCSLPYMRKLFFQEYGILPGKYRNTRRMNRIMELLAQTDFSLKMIADEVGMKNLTHLYAFLRNEQNLSPKELMEQIRGRRNR